MKLTDYIVEELINQGIRVVFGYIGGNIADLVDSICRSSIRFVQNYHEQASALAANAYAQVSGGTGVAIASGGPGAVNLLNGIANSYFDSIPCVFITGNVHSLGKKSSEQIRQNAFQEMDIVKIVQSITKYAVQVCNEADIRQELQKAFFIANAGRKGPVLIDIPYDIQRKNIDPQKLKGYPINPEHYDDTDATSVIRLLAVSARPILLVGGGCVGAGAELHKFLEKARIPIVASMRGLDAISNVLNNYIGFLGSYGNRYANLAVRYCDLLIVLGSRLDERQMGYKREEFAPQANIIQVDIDKFELGRKLKNTISIHAHVSDFLHALNKLSFCFSYDKWTAVLKGWTKKYASISDSAENFTANDFLCYLSNNLDMGANITVDVGQNLVFSAQSLQLKKDSRFLCSSGLACMGYSLPAAIGAWFACPDKQTVSINGDGGIQMNLQELQTICREKLPIKIIVINNHSLGLIRKLQENLFQKRYFASVEGFSCPNLKKIAHAYGLEYLEICSIEEYPALLQVLASPGPVIIDVELPIEIQATPEPGVKIYEQKPELPQEEYNEIELQIEAI